MPYNFNFQAPSRPLVNAPTGAFANLTGTLDRKYNEGELITEQAKDLFGTMDVATGDQVLRNQLSDEVATGLNQLVEDYKGAYESKQFQRDAKSYIRKMAADERIKVMRDTAEEEKFQKDLMRKSRMDKNMNLIQLGRDDVPASRYNPETGQWTAYVSPYEAGMDWLGDASTHIGKLEADRNTLLPTLQNIAGIGSMVRTGQKDIIKDEQLTARINEVIDEFAISNNGGNQLARKIAFDISGGESTDIYDEEGNLKSGVRERLAEYLWAAESKQLKNNTMYNYSFVPRHYIGDEQAQINQGFDLTRPIEVKTGIKNAIGLDMDNFEDKMFFPSDSSYPIGQGTAGSGFIYKGDKKTPFKQRFTTDEWKNYSKMIEDLSSQLYSGSKKIDPESNEAREMFQSYLEEVRSISTNAGYTPFTRMGEEGRSRREDATKDVLSDPLGYAIFSFEDGRLMKDKERLKIQDNKGFEVVGIMNPKNPVAAIENSNFANSFYAVDDEGNQYAVAMNEGDQQSMVGRNNMIIASIDNATLYRPGLRTKLDKETTGAIGLDDVEVRRNVIIDENGKIVPTGTFNLWVDGNPILDERNEQRAFTSGDQLINVLPIIRSRKNARQ